MAEVDALLAWLNTFQASGLPHVGSLEDFVLHGAYWRALTLIGPAYATGAMEVPPAPHSADTVAKLSPTFLGAMRAFDERELHLPSYDLLNVDVSALVTWVQSGEPHMTLVARTHALRMLKLLLAAAVKCDDKALFIPQLQTLPRQTVQPLLMGIIQNELLKVPVVTASEETARLRARVAQLESEYEDVTFLRERNAELMRNAAVLEAEMAAVRNGERGAAHASSNAELHDDWKAEQVALRDKLRTVQDELIRRDQEARVAEASAAEASARLRDARGLRDELDMAKERVAELTAQLSEARESSAASDKAPALAKELHDVREELRALKAEHGTLRDANSALKRDHGAMRAELTRHKVELEQAAVQLKVKSEEADKANAAWVASRGEVGTVAAQIDALKLELANARAQLKAAAQPVAQSAGASLLDELQVAPEEQQKWKHERDALVARLEQMEADFQAEADTEREQFKALLRQAHETAEKARTDAAEELRGARAELEALRAHGSRSVTDAAAEAMRVASECEALRVALARAQSELAASKSAAAEATKQAAAKMQALADDAAARMLDLAAQHEAQRVAAAQDLAARTAALSEHHESAIKKLVAAHAAQLKAAADEHAAAATAATAEAAAALKREQRAEAECAALRERVGAAEHAKQEADAKCAKLKDLLKVAKEKIFASGGATAPLAETPAAVVDESLELRVMAAHVHRVGQELMRLRHQVDVLRKERSDAAHGAAAKHNGLLNHLRFAVDPYSMV